ncbi:hypothetical protein PtrSN001C_000482 [Pyrenophora tritici-repentis]|nr:hypothetical protein PtrSN001C_000482 [Pyrenophora tritici-repentis]
MYLATIHLTMIFPLSSLILAAPATSISFDPPTITSDPTKPILATDTHTLCVSDPYLTSSGFAVPPSPGSVIPTPDEQQEVPGFDTTTATAPASQINPASSTGVATASSQSKLEIPISVTEDISVSGIPWRTRTTILSTISMTMSSFADIGTTGGSVASTMVPIDPLPSSNATWPVSQASLVSMASEFTWPTTPFTLPGGWGTTMGMSRTVAATTTLAG